MCSIPLSFDWSETTSNLSFCANTGSESTDFPFRRGYLFYGPPGNGKTTVIKVMASHPAITPLTFDFGSECMNNESLSGFFEEAARNAPSLLIFEDLDRAFVVKDDRDQRSENNSPALPELP